VKPLIHHVITFGAGHFYISQSDKGGLVFGGDIDGYNSYAQRGNLPTVEDVCEGGMAIMPMIGRLRIVRSWGGLMDTRSCGGIEQGFGPIGYDFREGQGSVSVFIVRCELKPENS